jgi:hypothetical protein
MQEQKARKIAGMSPGLFVVTVILGLVLIVVIGVILSCSGCCAFLSIIPTLTPSNTPTITPIPTNTLVPTSTKTPIPTLTPTYGPTPTPTNTPIPTSTPMPTNTPSPTNTPVPTATHTPVPTTDPRDLLDEAAQHEFGSRLRSVEDTGDGYVVTYDLQAVWDEEGAVRAAAMDLIHFAPMAFSIDGVDLLDLKSVGSFTDVYGNKTMEVAFSLVITREAADKVNWDSVNPHNIGTILAINGGCSADVHLALQTAWYQYMSE